MNPQLLLIAGKLLHNLLLQLHAELHSTMYKQECQDGEWQGPYIAADQLFPEVSYLKQDHLLSPQRDSEGFRKGRVAGFCCAAIICEKYAKITGRM